MVRLLILFILCFIYPSFNLSSQVPSTGIFFQAVARDNYANPAKDRIIYVQSSIIQTTINGTKILTEEFKTNSDATGIFSISIGQGLRIGGVVTNLSNINWEKGPFYLNLKISITPTAPVTDWDYTKDWIDIGTTPFGTVPYSLYALNTLGMEQKLNIADSLKSYVTPAQLNSKTFDITPINSAIATKINLSDSNINYITPFKFSSGLVGPQGLQGEIGPQGMQGLQGQMGFSGMSGTNGIDGISNVIADLSAATGILPTSNGGTGLSLIGDPGNQLKVNAAGTGFEFFTPSTNTNSGNFSFIDNQIKATSIHQTNFDPIILGNDAVTLKIDNWSDDLNTVLIGNAINGKSATIFSSNTATSINSGGSYLGWYDYSNRNDNYTEVSSTSNGAFVTVSNDGNDNSWHFDNSGNLNLPDLGTIIFTDGYRSIRLADILPIPLDDGSNENYVLTADAEGNASWQLSASSKSFSVVFTENINPDSDPFGFNDDEEIHEAIGLDDREANNIYFGDESFMNNVDGIANISIGDNSLKLNTSGSANTGVGYKVFANNTTGNANNAFGAYALHYNTEGSFNSAFGISSLLANTTGGANSGFGFQTLASNTTADYNAAFGSFALKFNTTGNANSAFGRRALESNTEGEDNSTFGAWSLQNNTAGNFNTAIGTYALNTNHVGNYNTAIGYEADVSEDDLENATAIGAGAVVRNSNTIQLGSETIVDEDGNIISQGITNIRTSGTLTLNKVTYPNIDGVDGQVLTTDGNGNLTWSNPTVTNSDGTVVLTGPQGPVGLTGIQGIQGLQGVQGLRGLQGIQGPSGNSSNEFSSLTVNSAGGSPGIFLNQLTSSSPTWLRVGTGDIGAEYGVSGGSNQFFDGTVMGDIALKAFSGSPTGLTKMFIGAAFNGEANLVLSPDRTTEVIGKLTAPELTVGTSTSTISAALDINSTSKGFLPPRLTTNQKNAIVSPVAGLVLWCSDCAGSGALQVYNGSAWINL